MKPNGYLRGSGTLSILELDPKGASGVSVAMPRQVSCLSLSHSHTILIRYSKSDSDSSWKSISVAFPT